MDDDVVNQKEAAKLLGLAVTTLSRYRRAGTGPRVAERASATTVLYRRADVLAWRDARRRSVPTG